MVRSTTAEVGLLAVLVPLLVSIRRRCARPCAPETDAVRRDLHVLAERVARIEGAMARVGAPVPPAH